MKKILILYHANCQDGLGAAYAAWVKFGDKADYVPVSYGAEEPPDVTGKIVYILDFSYKRSVLLEMHSKAKKLVVIDHHKTAQDDLVGLDFAHFDMNRSGCILAWDYFHSPDTPPLGLVLIQDRDLWRFVFDATKPYCAALWGLVPNDLESLSRSLNETSVNELVARGRDLITVFNADVEELQKHKHVITLNGHTGLACNANAKYASELGHKLATESGTFGAIYCYDGQTKLWFYSLRSIENFDVSEIAKAYGGGGHPRASGFSIKQLLMD